MYYASLSGYELSLVTMTHCFPELYKTAQLAWKLSFNWDTFHMNGTVSCDAI